ncbi:hypothetical protein [Leptospirillum ferrooxidans]|uniref:hypothetical protein n=1 Tax=Leptospirillum ferrooxidans TaxID=180 RepID=UPI0011D2190C|nr:hypothetical protein [Leptospirillum ferrooxidans]
MAGRQNRLAQPDKALSALSDSNRTNRHLDSFREAKDRKLTYRFADLEGIIFGIRTPLEDKVRIFNIIATKYKEHGRGSFEFSQAAYSGHSGKIEIRRLDLLRVNGS